MNSHTDAPRRGRRFDASLVLVFNQSPAVAAAASSGPVGRVSRARNTVGPAQQGHREQALEPISEHDSRLTVRVDAHTDMGRRRRRFNVGRLLENKHSNRYRSTTHCQDECSYGRVEEEEKEEEEEIQRRSGACSQHPPCRGVGDGGCGGRRMQGAVVEAR